MKSYRERREADTTHLARISFATSSPSSYVIAPLPAFSPRPSPVLLGKEARRSHLSAQRTTLTPRQWSAISGSHFSRTGTRGRGEERQRLDCKWPLYARGEIKKVS